VGQKLGYGQRAAAAHTVQIVFLSRARAALIGSANFLAPQGASLSARAVDTLFAAAYSLADQPERGRPAARIGDRELIVPFGGGAYVIDIGLINDKTPL
jgi:plasmid stabilization system protein ParE